MTQVRADTCCRECGLQPVDFHRDEHITHPTWRVTWLVTQGQSIARIQRELALCIPLCRRCHMLTDGRLERLQQTPRTVTVGKPCVECGHLAKPLRNGRCARCDRHWRNPPRYTADERRAIRQALVAARNKEAWMREAVAVARRRECREGRGRWANGG
jgi:hypothetical protein